MMLRYVLIAILTLPALSAWAEERAQLSWHDELNFEEPFEQAIGISALRSLLNQALNVIENHIELNGSMQPNDQTGEKQGRFQLKLYPYGKSQSDEHISAELRFRSSPDDQHFSFDLKHPEESLSPPLTSPDNTL